MDISKLIDWIKLKPIYLFPISLTSALLLFLSEDYISKLGLTKFANDYKPFIGIIFLLSSTLLFSYALKKIYNWIKTKIFYYKKKKELKHLSPEEKVILGEYIFNETKTQYFSVQDGRINGLRKKGIIYLASNLGTFDQFAYNIRPWAWKYLMKNPHLLELKPEEQEKLEERYS